MTSRTKTRWLDEQEQLFWRRWLSGVTLVNEAIERDLKDQGLNNGDYEVLVQLSEAEDRRLRMSELAERSIHTPSRLSMRVDRLAKAGLVVRERCPDDGRGFFATLTDAGFQRLASAAPNHVASVRSHLIDRLTAEEVSSMSRLLAKLQE